MAAPVFGARPNSAAHKDEFHRVVGERIHQIRDEQGLGRTELAKRCGFNESTIVNAETGASCSLYVLAKLAEALDVTLDDLVPIDALKDEL